MIDTIKKVWNWLNDSNRMKHLVLAYVVGLGCDDLHCAEYVATTMSGALEFKDVHHDNGDKPIKDWNWKAWDWIDFAFTFVGVNLGYGTRRLIFG